MAKTGRAVIDGGAKMQKRGGRRQDITPEQLEIFLATLGDSCNVVRSARAAGFSACWAYRLRRRDAAFRAGWAEAVREGYAKLELVLLERAMKGTAKPILRRDGSVEIIREYSTPLAVALLKKHADAAAEAAYEHGEDELREVRDRIIEKLERMRALDEADGSGKALIPPVNTGEGIETKGIDRVKVILWGLGKAKKEPAPSRSRERGG